MPRPAPTDRPGWLTLAKERIDNILSVRIAATIRQLEAKICEAGPAHLRPQPHILGVALQDLVHAGKIKKIQPKGDRHVDTPFFALAQHYPQAANERVQQLLVHYQVHRMLTDKEQWCSRVLENIVQASFASASGYEYLGRLPSANPLDCVFGHGTLGTVGIEVKNIREWVYPSSSRIWGMIGKCLELDALPVLVARKLAYVTRALFKRIGVFGFDFHRQVFSTHVEAHLGPIRDTDLLGYKDVIALPESPYPPLVQFASVTLPRHGPGYVATWKESRELLLEFAVNRNWSSPNVRDETRKAQWPSLAALVFGVREQELPDDYHY